MEQTIVDCIRECTEGSLAGTMAFPEVVRKLTDMGLETYHVDLYRAEKTAYLPSGESHVESGILPRLEIASSFSAVRVRDAIKASQQGQITYREFLERIVAAGTTHYFVYLVGKRAVYIGRDGSEHRELFPQAI